MSKSKFRVNDLITFCIGSGSEKRDGVVIDTMPNLVKVELTYISNGKEKTFNGWYPHKFITKRKK